MREPTRAPTSRAPSDRVATAVVAVAVGDGVRRLLASLGVQQIVAGGQSMNPSTAQILEAVERCPSDSVIVLPNNKNIVPVARQVDALTREAGRRRAHHRRVEALAALVAYDPDAELATTSTRCTARSTGSAPVRSRRRCATASASAVRSRPGDWIAIARDGIVAAVGSPVDAAFALVDALVDDDSEIVTVLVGTDAPAAETAAGPRARRVRSPHVELEVHDGGQPLYPYLIGVE